MSLATNAELVARRGFANRIITSGVASRAATPTPALQGPRTDSNVGLEQGVRPAASLRPYRRNCQRDCGIAAANQKPCALPVQRGTRQNDHAPRGRRRSLAGAANTPTTASRAICTGLTQGSSDTCTMRVHVRPYASPRLLVECERRRQLPVRLDLRLQIGDLLLGSGNGISTGDEAARRGVLVGNGNE
jgi:hypothetical protein